MKAIVYSAQAIRQLRALPPQIRVRLQDKLLRYVQTGAGDLKSMVGFAETRLRVGDYRIVFKESEDTVDVRTVAKRDDVYR